MDYDTRPGLFIKKQGNFQEQIDLDVSQMAHKLNPKIYALIVPGSITIIESSYDQLFDRTMIRTDTIPNKDLPKQLTDLLNEKGFEKISLSS